MDPKQQKIQEIKQKTKEKLESFLNRAATPSEIVNAVTDVGLIVQVLIDRVAELEVEVGKLKV